MLSSRSVASVVHSYVHILIGVLGKTTHTRVHHILMLMPEVMLLSVGQEADVMRDQKSGSQASAADENKPKNVTDEADDGVYIMTLIYIAINIYTIMHILDSHTFFVQITHHSYK